MTPPSYFYTPVPVPGVAHPFCLLLKATHVNALISNGAPVAAAVGAGVFTPLILAT